MYDQKAFYELRVVHAQMLQIIRVGALAWPVGRSVGRNINNGERACSVALMRGMIMVRVREEAAGFCCCCRSTAGGTRLYIVRECTVCVCL